MSEIKVEKTCAVCKFASHDPSLGNRPEVLCLLSVCSPVLKQSNDTCLEHVPKYKNLKIIEDKGTYLEYDTEKVDIKTQPLPGREGDIKQAGVEEVGEEEWLK